MGTKRFKNTETVVNHDTGEVQTITKEFSIKVKEEDFFMTFIGHLSSFYKITSITDVKVLAKLCERVQFNTTQVLLPGSKRKEIMQELKISTQTFSNSLSRLKELTLINGADGEYNINPEIMWKGSTAERRKLLDSGRLEFKINFVNHEV